METNSEKLRRFTTDKFSFNDYLSVKSFFKKEEYGEGLMKYMEDDWHETKNSGENQERLNQILNQLHHKIIQGESGKTKVMDKFYHWFTKAAAVLIIPALITVAVLSYLSVKSPEMVESWAEIHSPIGSRTKFQLPDGTMGWLNSSSSIKYPTRFMQDRRVEISGEAWFDVVHIKSGEFRVITPYFDVKVLGTKFNVVAYEDEQTAEVILEKGKVVVLGKDHTIQGELIPDQQLIYNKSTMGLNKTSIDSKSYSGWKDGLLIFKNEPMSEIARRLERRYNADIILHGDSLKSSIFRATFQYESLDEICKMLATVAPIDYKIHKREKLADNTFTRGKVEMWLKKFSIKQKN